MVGLFNVHLCIHRVSAEVVKSLDPYNSDGCS